eukprot:351548-Chlamydomonas_euryale.AAC.12
MCSRHPRQSPIPLTVSPHPDPVHGGGAPLASRSRAPSSARAQPKKKVEKSWMKAEAAEADVPLDDPLAEKMRQQR